MLPNIQHAASISGQLSIAIFSVSVFPISQSVNHIKKAYCQDESIDCRGAPQCC